MKKEASRKEYDSKNSTKRKSTDSANATHDNCANKMSNTRNPKFSDDMRSKSVGDGKPTFRVRKCIKNLSRWAFK